MRTRHLLLVTCALCGLMWMPSRAQALRGDDGVLPENLQVSYLYAAVMGTGTYKVDGRRISMLRIPVSFSKQEPAAAEQRITWSAPVVLGYDEISTEDWLETVFNEKIGSLSVLPGFEYRLPISDTWVLKPFGHLGITQDFTRHETMGMGIVGLRALGTWQMNDGSEFRWGNSIRFAAEKQFTSGADSNFTLIETGVDYRRYTGWTLNDRKVNVGVYYILQNYVPEWGGLILGRKNSSVHAIHQIGISMGLHKKIKILGVPFSRVRFGVERGDGGHGWSIGTEFPF